MGSRTVLGVFHLIGAFFLLISFLGVMLGRRVCYYSTDKPSCEELENGFGIGPQDWHRMARQEFKGQYAVVFFNLVFLVAQIVLGLACVKGKALGRNGLVAFSVADVIISLICAAVEAWLTQFPGFGSFLVASKSYIIIESYAGATFFFFLNFILQIICAILGKFRGD